MKFPLCRARSSLVFGLFSVALLLGTSGCGRHASKPASSLSEKDRTVLEKYEEIRAAMAVDDLRSVKHYAADLRKYLKPSADTPGTPLDDNVGQIADAVVLDKARDGFKELSVGMVKLADGVDGYYVFDSPVPEGAEWVQRTTKIENPYVGKAMRDVGTLRK